MASSLRLLLSQGDLTDTGRALVDSSGGGESKVNVAIFKVLRRNECQ